MKDFQADLRLALQQAASTLDAERPPVPGLIARVRRRRRRRVALTSGVGAAAAVLATAAVASLLVSNEGGQQVEAGAPRDRTAITPVTGTPQTPPVATRPSAVLGLPSAPGGIAISAGDVWVAQPYGDTILRISGETNEIVARIDPSKFDRRASGGGIALASGPAGLWVASGSSSDSGEGGSRATAGWVARIDPATNGLRDFWFPGGDAPSSIAVADGVVWVSGGRRVRRLDTRDLRVSADVALPSESGTISAGLAGVWVGLPGRGEVVRLDPDRGTVTATIPVANAVGDLPVFVGADSVWAGADTAVVQINPVTGVPRRTTEIPGRLNGIAEAGDLVWIYTEDAVLSLSRDESEARVRVHLDGRRLGSLAASPTSAWVGDGATASLTRIDA